MSALFCSDAKVTYALLVILDTGRVTAGCDPGGVIDVQETDCPSLEIARVPSFFL